MLDVKEINVHIELRTNHFFNFEKSISIYDIILLMIQESNKGFNNIKC